MDPSFSKLRDVSIQWKGADFDRDASELTAYVEDNARALTLQVLEALGMGVTDGTMAHPPDLGIMRWLVQQLAVGYLKPPTRWLVDEGVRLPEDSREHTVLTETLARSQYDGAWQAVDEARALARQCVVRVYPLDKVKRCSVRVFAPQHVMREPSDEVPALMDYDAQFALRLSGNRFEWWTQTSDGWRCEWVDANGARTAKQPYPETDGVAPYGELPVVMIHDAYADGTAWLPLRTHRLGVLKSLSAISAELLQLVRLQGHSQRWFSGVVTNELSKERGPGVDLVFQNPDAAAGILNPQPQISASLDVARQWLKWLLASEELPLDALNDTKTILTGSALKVSRAGLIDRRERLAQVARVAEPDLYRRFRSVHNLHCSGWGVEPLDETSDLEVQLAPLSFPSSDVDVLEVGSRKIALGLASRIDVLCELENISRADAIKRLEQVDRDLEDYPVRTEPSVEDTMTAGPRTISAPDEVLDNPTKASVADAILEQE